MVKKFTWQKIVYGDEPKTLLNWYGYYGEEELGYLEYWGKWKKWVWNQGEDIIMSKNCLQEVLKKMENLTKSEVKTKQPTKETKEIVPII